MTAASQQPDVVDILTTDHHDVLELIGQIRSSTDSEQCRDLADTVIAEIVRHSVAEEMYVYPAMREHLPDGDAKVEHDISEHEQLEKTMKRLEGLDAKKPEFSELVTALEGQLRHHADDEETNQFPQLRSHFSPETLRELGQKVDAAKQVAPTRPHPGAPHAELFHKLVGPGVGLVDKLRDSLTGRSHNT